MSQFLSQPRRQHLRSLHPLSDRLTDDLVGHAVLVDVELLEDGLDEHALALFVPERDYVGPYTIKLEARKFSNSTSSYCVDSVYDWDVASSHHDARMARQCVKTMTPVVWDHYEGVPVGSAYYGDKKHGACYLLNPTNGGPGTGVKRIWWQPHVWMCRI